MSTEHTQRVVKLSRLLRAVPQVLLRDGTAATDITGIALDSRRVYPGALFCALPGEKSDGGNFAEDAIRRGAVAILHQNGLMIPKGVANLFAPDARAAMAELSAAFYGDPSSSLAIIGVTGTNGKTTTTFMIREIMQAAHRECGLVGTIFYEYGGRRISATRTTPEAPDLQRMFAEALAAKCQVVAMEVSSQGLAAGRLRGTKFAAGVFTNLSVDHLDFHKTMEDYFAAKMQMFDEWPAAAPIIVNGDDPYGQRIAADPRLKSQVVTFGFGEGNAVRASKLMMSAYGSSFLLTTPWGEMNVKLSLAGRFNVMNALAACTTCCLLDVPPKPMWKALITMKPVPGRLEQIMDSGGRHIFVDYAHTAEALRCVLQTLRENTMNRLICVFGCGGNRDRSKRPCMGAAVSESADFAILTSDNPRNENPQTILDDVLEGMDRTRPHVVEPDRAAAIALALRQAAPGDVVLIAGKGHEPYQEIAGRMVAFDDREVVRAWLATNEGA